MENVWGELYRRRHGQNGGYFNPARIGEEWTAASLLRTANEFRLNANGLRTKADLSEKERTELKKYEEYAHNFERAAQISLVLPDERSAERWTEQDQAVRAFFSRIYRAALDSKPQLASSSEFKAQKLRAVARKLCGLAEELKSLKLIVTEGYAQKLIDVAFDCDSDATVISPNVKGEPWLNMRNRGDMRGRAFVGRAAHAALSLFDKELDSTIATLANVVSEVLDLERKDYNRKTIRNMLRSNARRNTRRNEQSFT
jgi:hypothetical protein